MNSDSYNWENRTILIVEDDKFNAYIIENFLKATKAKIFVAVTGEKGVELAKTINPDLVMMDIKLPGINGIEAIHQIKAFLPNVLIIAQTAYATDSDKQEALDAGCIDFISKPIRSNVLLSTISKYL